MVAKHGEGALDLMRRIQHAFEPNDILNLGKVLPPHG